MESLEKLLDGFPSNTPGTIVDAIIKANAVLDRYEHPTCSISGGSDSDVLLDLISRVDTEKKVTYLWFDTGLEYKATKQQLTYLELRYGIQIQRMKAIKPIPVCCKEYGLPFLSKRVSNMIQRLQQHGFQWENEPYDVLAERYPGCKAALRWWTGSFGKDGERSHFDIAQNKYLKEFMLQHPPTFRISDMCCTYAKKGVSKKYNHEHDVDLVITGVRKAEGGARATVYKNCWSQNDDEIDSFRPIFWFKNSDKEAYDQIFHITHSDCYEKWGFARTGCVGCPFGRNCLEEIEIAGQYEPNIEKAARNIFGVSYEYTAQYQEFVKFMKQKERDTI